MKISLLVLGLFIGFNGVAETPERIYPKTKIIKPVEWYARQASLWKEEIRNSSEKASAWLNYYVATRYAQGTEEELTKIANQVSKAVPGTFENHLVQSWNLGFSKQSFKDLMIAYELQPENPLTYSSMILMHEYLLREDLRKEFSAKLMNTSLVSASLLNYSYNVLMSLEDNAILFTDSDNTTLPLFLLQDVIGIRNDVKILNLDMLPDEAYRNAKLSSLNLVFKDNISASRQEICSLLPEQNSSRVFYYALTLSKENIFSIKDQLYVVGLASQLSTRRIDNISLIKNNLENRYLMDYLTVDFNGENEFAAGKVLNANYLVPMLLLLEHYQSTKELDKAEELEDRITQIAQQTGKSLLVDNFLKRSRSENRPFIAYKIETKSLEGKFKPVKDNIYAAQNEVTNAEYNAYLKYLKENKRTELYEVSKIHFEQYEEPALSFMKGYHLDRTPTKKEKYFSNYPVVNVSYDGALAYCNWLTEQYNNTEGRKFKRVKFRLPTLNEWKVAALGYKKIQSWILEENKIELQIQKSPTDMVCSKGCEKKVVAFTESGILYPWFGAYYYRDKALNSKGCPLGNFKWPDSMKPCQAKMSSADGFILMSMVEAYFPNDIGLYDVVGNVAEMTNEKGKACGGSWNHTPEESTILSINTYEDASSEIGFRVFMEVIEQ
jgi:hypothetical protein